MHHDDIEASGGVAVHTGFPNPATDASLQSLDLHKLLVPNGASTYLMEIASNEWNESGIFAGDIALVDRSLTPRMTDIVVWWHADAFAVSLKSRVPEGATIWGVVSSVIHQFRKRELRP